MIATTLLFNDVNYNTFTSIFKQFILNELISFPKKIMYFKKI